MLKLLLTVSILQVVLSRRPIVITKDGALQGSVLKDLDGNNFLSFQSVPFAKPPVGVLRYKDPQPPKKWKGVRDATKEAPTCLQKPFLLGGEFVGVEDCLYLNVYTPALHPKILKPVIVFIYGGGFAEGTGGYSTYGPEFLLSKDIILVTPNYRVGIFGFMNFANPDIGVPGNAALKDQVAALKWIKKNIIYFGGDPNKVTIMGESAGGGSVHLHVLSPLSQGLFQKAIIQSGNALSTWCNGEVNNGVATAKALGFEGDDEFGMLEFLQSLDQEQLKAASINVTTVPPIHILLTFGPTIERNSPTAFLSDSPRNILKRGGFNRSIPLMMGLTSQEGMIIDALFTRRDGVYEFKPENFVPYYLNLTSMEKAKLIEEIKEFYNLQDLSTPDNHMDFQGDSFFIFSTYEALFAHLHYGQTIYFYLFSSYSTLNYFQNSNLVTINYKGVCHWDDLWYLYTHSATPASAFTSGSIENKAIRNSVGLMANFAKYGHPTLPSDPVQWESVGSGPINYLNIILDQNYPGVEVFKERIVFWCDVYRRYNQENFCPTSWTNSQ